MPRYAEKISEQDLINKILEAHNNHPGHRPGMTPATNLDDFLHGFILLTLSPQIEKDLAKISFDGENVCGGTDCFTSPTPNIMEAHTTPSGVTFFGFLLGGDWEFPVYFIIYWDGKELRAYIPTDGQWYDVKGKCAYGSGEEEGPEDPLHDPQKLLNDITNRIQLR